MDVLVHAGKPDERSAPVGDRTDDASRSRAPSVGFARERCSHREARSGVPCRERHKWSIRTMKAAAKLKVVRVIHIHVRKRSAEEPLAQASNARCKQNCLRHVKPSIGQPRHSCYAAGRKKTCANEKWTRPAEERELTRGALQILAALEARRLHCPHSPAVQRRNGHGCQHGDCARHSVTFRQPWTGRDGAIVVRILRPSTGHDDSGGEHRAGSKYHTQE